MKLSIFCAALVAAGLVAAMPSRVEAGEFVSPAFERCFYKHRMFVSDEQAVRICAGGRNHYGRSAARPRGIPCGGTCGNGRGDFRSGYAAGMSRGQITGHGTRIKVRKWHKRSVRIERREWHIRCVNGECRCMSGNCPPPPWD